MHIWKPGETSDDLLESPIGNAEGNSGARGRGKEYKIEGVIRRTGSQFYMHRRSIK